MSILEKWSKAIDERDIDGMSKLIHDNYELLCTLLERS